MNGGGSGGNGREEYTCNVVEECKIVKFRVILGALSLTSRWCCCNFTYRHSVFIDDGAGRERVAGKQPKYIMVDFYFL